MALGEQRKLLLGRKAEDLAQEPLPRCLMCPSCVGLQPSSDTEEAEASCPDAVASEDSPCPTGHYGPDNQAPGIHSYLWCLLEEMAAQGWCHEKMASMGLFGRRASAVLGRNLWAKGSISMNMYGIQVMETGVHVGYQRSLSKAGFPSSDKDSQPRDRLHLLSFWGWAAKPQQIQKALKENISKPILTFCRYNTVFFRTSNWQFNHGIDLRWHIWHHLQ